jgi:hypothetical protein
LPFKNCNGTAAPREAVRAEGNRAGDGTCRPAREVSREEKEVTIGAAAETPKRYRLRLARVMMRKTV